MQMHVARTLALGIALGLLGVPAYAQAQASAAPQKVGLALSMQRAYDTVKGNLTRAAAAMPETEYGFKIVSIPEVRTFGQWLGHQTDNQLGTCAALKGVPNPILQGQPNNERKWTTKAEFVKALADAFSFCDSAVASLTDQSALQMVKQGQNDVARGGLVSALLSHALETNGILTLYFRAKGIAPPPPEGAAGRGAARGAQ